MKIVIMLAVLALVICGVMYYLHHHKVSIDIKSDLDKSSMKFSSKISND